MKQQILFLLLNFSSEEHPLNSRYFYYRMYEYASHASSPPIDEDSLKVFQRKLTFLIDEIQEDEYKNYKAGKDFHVILSNSNGYYVARNLQEAIRGKEFLVGRVKDIVIRANKIKELIQYKFNTELNEPDLFI